MKYPGNISSEAYAAMEEGYEQGYEKGYAAAQEAPVAAVVERDEKWRHTLEYAATALEASSDNGDRYCAAQIRARLAADDAASR
jgi:flagellar biosynthesis/type III secretory pathway protein FliH